MQNDKTREVKTIRTALGISFFVMCSVSQADVYVLGSSYSDDAIPWALDDQPQWHIDCGKPLQYIYLNPLSPCDRNLTIWPVALSATAGLITSPFNLWRVRESHNNPTWYVQLDTGSDCSRTPMS